MSYAKLQSMRHELRRRRRVGAPLHNLKGHQRGMLLRTKLEDFFEPEFLYRALERKWDRELPICGPNILHTVKSVWPDVKTFGQLARRCEESCLPLAQVSGFGGAALTILTDSLMAFGFKAAFEPQQPKSESERAKRALKLAKKLGIL